MRHKRRIGDLASCIRPEQLAATDDRISRAERTTELVGAHSHGFLDGTLDDGVKPLLAFDRASFGEPGVVGEGPTLTLRRTFRRCTALDASNRVVGVKQL